MRTFVSAMLFALSSGEMHQSNVAIPTFISDGITMSGSWTETFDDTLGLESVNISVTFRTGGQKWNTGYFVQNYLSIQDSLDPGNLQTFTCSTQYVRTNSYADEVTVNNYYGANSWMTTAGSASWDLMNKSDKQDGGWKIDTGNP